MVTLHIPSIVYSTRAERTGRDAQLSLEPVSLPRSLAGYASKASDHIPITYRWRILMLPVLQRMTAVFFGSTDQVERGKRLSLLLLLKTADVMVSWGRASFARVMMQNAAIHSSFTTIAYQLGLFHLS